MSTKTISTTVSRTYCIIDKDEKFYCNQFINDNGYRKEIHLYNTPPNGIAYAKQQGNMSGYAFETAMAFMKLLETVAPIDIRVLLQNVEIADNARKAEIIASCKLIEFKNETKQSYTVMSDANIKTVREEVAARAKLTSFFQEKLNSVQGFDLKECKKIQTAMESL